MNNAFLRGFLKCGLILPHQFIDRIVSRILGRTQFFSSVFSLDLTDRFLCRLTRFCFARFFADLWLANLHSLLVFVG